MNWSPQQSQALDAVGRWLKRGDKPYFMLAGYAGTGKTTLARHLAEQVQGDVYFAAFTGKAAHVLQQHGAPNAETIHKLIYVPSSKSKERLRQLRARVAALKAQDPVDARKVTDTERALREEEENLSRPAFTLNLDSPLKRAALVVVDEYSMISEPMGNDLLSFGCPVLALGDPAQLPPVRGKAFFSGDPDFLLTQIHRQAEGNPIIELATTVREGGRLKPGSYGTSVVLNRRDVAGDKIGEWVLRADQLLVGRNKTRATSNQRARQLLGRNQEMPCPGDKIVCLRNNHEAGLLNGQLWETAGCEEAGDRLALDIINEGGDRQEVLAHAQYFRGGKPDHWDIGEAECFDYGYALTVHKAQGSQWNDVLLFDEWGGNNRKEWLYTAITRAAERVTVIKL